MIIVVEGPSAAGKTTWCRAHAPGFVPEPEPGPITDVLVAQRRRWRAAVAADGRGEVVVLDGDPLKLWYSFAQRRRGEITEDDWRGDISRCRADLVAGDLGFADVVLYADPGVAELTRRREADPTRTRRNFDRHTAMRPSFQQWYRALAAIEPARVVWQHPAAGVDAELLAIGRRRARCDPGLLDQVLAGLDDPDLRDG